jgi:ligand-binding sensor domain-containing protein
MKKIYFLSLAFTLVSCLSLSAQVDIKSGLVAFYSFNGNTLDSSGNGNNAIISGATPTIDRFGDANSAYSFDGSYNTFSNSTIFPNAPTAFTVSWWLNPVSSSNWGHLLGASTAWGAFNFHSTVDNEVYVGTDATNRLTPTELGVGTVTLNVWQNFTFTYANNIGSFYKNGILLASKSMDAPIAWNGITTNSIPNAVSGGLDDIRVYDRALSDNEIQALFYDVPKYVVLGSTNVCNGSQTTLSIKASGSTSYKWDDDVVSNSILTVSPIKNTYFKYTITYPDKTVFDSVLVNVFENVASTVQIKASNTNPCSGESVTLTAHGASLYAWDNGKTTESISISPSVPTWVYVTPNACSDRDSIFIDVRSMPVLTVKSSSHSVCIGSTITFTASGADNYMWSTGESLNISVTTARFDNSFAVTASNNNGCYVVGYPMNPISLNVSQSFESSIYINSSTVDNSGGIWMINSDNKLEKYDGTAFTEYTDVNLSYGSAYSIVADKNGKIWLSTNNGLYVYDGSWTLSTFPQNDKIANGDIRSVYIDQQGNTWVLFFYYDPQMSGFLSLTNSGLFKYDGTTWSRIAVDNDYSKNVVVDANGNPWITNQGSISRYDGSNWITMSNSSFPIANPCVATDLQGNVWYADYNSNLIKTDGSSYTSYHIPDSINQPFDNVVSIFVDQNNKVWFCNGHNISGTNGNGLSTFENGDWANVKTTEGLTDNFLANIYNDAIGNIYAQGENGISKIGPTFQLNALPQPSIISSENASASQILIASGGTNYLWNTGETTAQITLDITESTPFTVTVSNKYGCLAFDSIVASTMKVSNNIGTVCEGTTITLSASGVNSYQWSTGEITPSITVTATRGCSYSVTGTDANGLTKVQTIADNGSKSWQTISNSFGNTILSAAVDFQGNDWAVISDGDGGQIVGKYDGSNFVPYSDPNLQYTSATEVKADPRGSIWILTDAGLYKYDGKTWENKFSQQAIQTLEFDKNGNAWIATQAIQGDGLIPSQLLLYNGKTWLNRTPSFASTGIQSISIDSNLNPWIVYNNETDMNLPTNLSVAKFDGQNWTKLSQYDQKIGTYIDGNIGSDHNGNVYISSGGSLYKTNATTTTKIDIPNHNLSNYKIGNLVIDNASVIWVTYSADNDNTSRLLSKFENGIWTTFDSQNSGLNSELGYTVFQDNSGTIYTIGTQTISKYGHSLQVKPLPKPVVSSKRINGIDVLTASGGSYYEWEGGEKTPVITVDLPTSTMYSVTVASDYGCTAVDSVVASTVLIYNNEKEVCETTVMTLTAAGAKSYMWSTGETTNSIVVTATPSCKYVVTATNEFGISAIDSVQDKGSKSWETIDVGSTISSSTIDKQGNLWAIANVDGYMLMKKDSVGWSIYDDPNGTLTYNNAYSVTTDKNGYVWFSTSSGIYRFDGITWQLMYDQDNWGLQADRNGKVWTVTAGTQNGGMAAAMAESLPVPQTSFNSGTTTINPAGLYQFDGQGWLNFTPSFISNPYNDIYNSTVDAKANVWLTYYNSSYSNLPGQSEYLVAKFDGQTWEQIDASNYSKGLNGGYISSDSKGAVYLQGKGVIYKTDGTSWTEIPYYNDGIYPNNINSLYVDQKDVLWASFYVDNSSTGSIGLSKYESGTWTNYNSVESGIADNAITNIFESVDGDIYAQGSQTISKYGFPFIVNPLPKSTITAFPATICKSQPVVLTASGASEYKWSTNETKAQITITPIVTSSYPVTLTSNKGCSINDTFKIVVPKTTITVSKDSICSGEKVAIKASGAKSYMWSIGSQNDSIVVLPKETTTYIVYSNTENGCSKIDSTTIVVKQGPTLTLTADPTSICQTSTSTLTVSGGTTYEWNTGDTQESFDVSPLSAQFYTVSSTSNGCTSVDSVKISVNAIPTVNVSTSANKICIGTSAILSASGAKSYMWSSGSKLASITVSPKETQNYYVVATGTNGCSADDSVTVTVNALPSLTLAAESTNICFGNHDTITVAGAKSYTWNISQDDTNKIIYTPTQTSLVKVTGVDSNGCINSASTTITVNQLPNVVAYAIPSTLNLGSQAKVQAEGAEIYMWDNSVVNGKIFEPTVTQTYTVTGIDANGCSSVASTSIVVTVQAIPTVTITSPTVNSYIPLASVLTISANAIKDGGTIDSVVFYADGTKIGVALTEPYTFDWVVAGSGEANITAIAYDNSGASATTVNTFWINEAPYLTQGSISEQIAQKDTSFASIDLAAFVADSYTAVTDLNVIFEPNPYLAITFINGKLVAKQLDSSWSGTTAILCTIADAQGLELQLPILYTQPYLLKSLLTKPTGGFYANKMVLKVNDAVRFYTSVIAADTVVWSFGGGIQTSGTDINPVVKYQNPGVYSISMNAINSIGDTIVTRKNYIIVSALSVLDTVLCKGNSMTIAASSGFTTYVWNTNPIQTTAAITVAPTKTTTYKVTMKKGLATVIDSVVVTIPKQPELGNDTTFCEGGSKRLTAGIFNSYFWNGSSTNGLPYFDAMKAGKVKVRTIDPFGCSASDSMTIGTLYPKPLLHLGNDSTFCWKKKLTLNAGNSGAKFIWNTGAKTQTIIADTTRLYSVTVTDSKFCVNSDTIAINVLVPLIPKIGLVTLSDAGYNLIAWEPQQNRGIAMYHVWKESNTAGTFAIIDTIYKNDTTVSIDKKSTPKVKSSTYALSIVDSACGIESGLSPIHNSIHLTCVLQQNGTVKATWNNYVGLAFTKYIIYRAVKGQKLQAYDTVDFNPNATQMLYIDENAIGLNSYYQVGFVLPQQINLSKLKSDSGPFSQSLSNMAESELTDVAITSIDATITVFPNPNNGQFAISIASEKAKKYTIELINELGQILLLKQTVEVAEAKLQIDASNFISGVYLLKVITNDGIATKQIVITR